MLGYLLKQITRKPEIFVLLIRVRTPANNFFIDNKYRNTRQICDSVLMGWMESVSRDFLHVIVKNAFEMIRKWTSTLKFLSQPPIEMYYHLHFLQCVLLNLQFEEIVCRKYQLFTPSANLTSFSDQIVDSWDCFLSTIWSGKENIFYEVGKLI